MAISLKHLFQSSKGDGPDNTVVQPGDWNAEHVTTLNADKVMGRATAGVGPVEEIPAGAYGRQLLATNSVADLNAIAGTMPTGAVMMFFAGTAPVGWVRANGGTIGNAGSGATENNSDVAWPLFNQFYAWYPDTVCPVSGGRSGVAYNDFVAAKTLRLPDCRGRVLAGDDAMGAAGWANVNPGYGFGQSHFGGVYGQVIQQSHLPAVQVRVTGATDQSGSHSHTYTFTAQSAKNVQSGSNSNVNQAAAGQSFSTSIGGLHIHPFTGYTDPLGLGNGFDQRQPFFSVFICIKL